MELQQQFGEDVVFIGVPQPGESVESNAGFIEGTGSGDIVHIQDDDGIIWARFGVAARQTYVLVDNDGTTQTIDFDELTTGIEGLVAN